MINKTQWDYIFSNFDRELAYRTNFSSREWEIEGIYSIKHLYIFQCKEKLEYANFTNLQAYTV